MRIFESTIYVTFIGVLLWANYLVVPAALEHDWTYESMRAFGVWLGMGLPVSTLVLFSLIGQLEDIWDW